MNALPWFLGIDLGTGSCKSVVIDGQSACGGFGTGAYAAMTSRERWREQNPQDLLEAAWVSVRQAMGRAGVDPAGCAGLSIGGALHSLLALDRHGRPLTGVITWADARAAAQAQTIRGTPMAEQLYQRTGCPAHAMYPLYKLIWLRQEKPELFRQAWRFVTAKEYLFARLTGEYLVDYALAAGSGLLNTRTLSWEPLCLDAAAIHLKQLSPLAPPLTVCRGLTPEAAGQLGLRSDLPVVLGSADAVNSNLGAGAVLPGQAVCMIGTSGALRVICPEPILDRQGRTFCYAIDNARWLVGGAINNGGVALSWLKDCLNQAMPSSPAMMAGPPLSFEDLLALAGRSGAGADGVMCLPFFAGERSPNWNPHARAAFVGLRLEHGAAELSRALLEGIALRFKHLHAILGEIGLPIRQVLASGGFTQSAFWLQLMADALNRELSVPAWGETSCLGAAFWTLLAQEGTQNFESLAAQLKPPRSCPPDPQAAAVYERLLPLYLKLYDALREPMAEADRWQQAPAADAVSAAKENTHGD